MDVKLHRKYNILRVVNINSEKTIEARKKDQEIQTKHRLIVRQIQQEQKN